LPVDCGFRRKPGSAALQGFCPFPHNPPVEKILPRSFVYMDIFQFLQPYPAATLIFLAGKKRSFLKNKK
jgi:hypothetical protein